MGFWKVLVVMCPFSSISDTHDMNVSSSMPEELARVCFVILLTLLKSQKTSLGISRVFSVQKHNLFTHLVFPIP